MDHQSIIQKVATGLFGALLLVFIIFYIKGYDTSIDWHVTTTAESDSFYTLPFKKGPFDFAFKADRYELAETFSAGPIQRNLSTNITFTLFSILGFSLLLAVVSYLPRFWFIGVMGLFIFFLMNIHLLEIGLFRMSGNTSIILLMVAFVIPGYLFHAFATELKLVWRTLIFSIISALVILFSGVDKVLLHDQFVSGSFFGFVAISLIYLFIVAEEVIFAILYLVTKSKGGRNNHIHFSALSLIYLAVIIAHYGVKGSFWRIEVPYFDPYGLLILSSAIAVWSIKFKKELYENLLTVTQARLLLSALGIIVFSFLSEAVERGNDSVYEGLHYFIMYAHVGFGTMFFLYVFWNFIAPLGEGLQVYKIVYRSGPFPYVTARIGGLVAIAAFFFLADKEAFKLFKAGHYNYQGDQYEQLEQFPLAEKYYTEALIYGYDNHYANYKIGYKALQDGNIKEANYRFKRASRRYPSAQSFINYSGTYALQGESTMTRIALEEGLVDFPGNNKLNNNLGLAYAEIGKLDDAVNTLAITEPDTEWSDASLVNLWKVVQPDSAVAKEDYQKGNLAVKANVLSNLINFQASADIQFDTSALNPSYPMHRLAYLINSTWYFDEPSISDFINQTFGSAIDQSMYYSGKNALILNDYKTGNINDALMELDYLTSEAPRFKTGEYYNQMGLIALSQHAPDLARDFFQKAADRGHQDSFTNLLASLLELGQFDAAKSWANYLVSLDSGFSRLKEDIYLLDQREGLSIDKQLFRLYYKYTEYQSSEIHALLAQTNDTGYIESLWQKVSNELIKSESFERLQEMRAVFNSFLPKKAFEETDFLMAIQHDGQIAGDHPLAEAMNELDTAARIQKLSKFAGKNALNEPVVLTACKIISQIDHTAAYDVLVSSININNKSVALHKQFILTALEIGLQSYAKDGLQKLATITTQTDYQDFYQKYLEQKSKIEAGSSW